MSQIYCVIDASGSMAHFIDRTITGFNEFIQSSKAGSFISCIIFNDTVKVVYENTKREHVKPLTAETYEPRGSTALLDGIGQAIELANKYEPKSWADSEENNVVILIMTDGYENASKTYAHAQINDLIKSKRLNGWNFIFMGANQDAIQTASDFSISEESSLTFGTENVNEAFRSVSHAIQRTPRGDSVAFTKTERSRSNPLY